MSNEIPNYSILDKDIAKDHGFDDDTLIVRVDEDIFEETVAVISHVKIIDTDEDEQGNIHNITLTCDIDVLSLVYSGNEIKDNDEFDNITKQDNFLETFNNIIKDFLTMYATQDALRIE